MALDLTPLPISIIFVVVLGLVCMTVLWKLRKRGKIYSILFNASILIVILLLVVFLYSTIMGMFG